MLLHATLDENRCGAVKVLSAPYTTSAEPVKLQTWPSTAQTVYPASGLIEFPGKRSAPLQYSVDKPGITSTPSNAAAPNPRSNVTPGALAGVVTASTVIEATNRFRSSPLINASLVKTTSIVAPAGTLTVLKS